MGNIGAWELVIIGILLIVIFGGKRLPELGRGLGRGLANFRQAAKAPGAAADSAPAPEDGAREETGPAKN